MIAILAELNAIYIFALPLRKWRHSSAGSEHLPYKQRVLGSNPCASTKPLQVRRGFFIYIHFMFYLYILYSAFPANGNLASTSYFDILISNICKYIHRKWLDIFYPSQPL